MVESRPRRLTLYLVIAICAAPVIASYFFYYFVRPDGRSNYGTLIEPQRTVPPLHLTTIDGRPFESDRLKGKWSLVMVAGSACPKACEDRLYHLRQVRLTTGKDRDRVQRVWLIPDREPLSTMVIREYDGTQMLRADANEIGRWLGNGNDPSFAEHIYVVDPLGNLMMRFPLDADPSRTKRDLAKLLRASSVG